MLRWYSVVIDCRDIEAEASWWADVLGWERVYTAPDEIAIGARYMVEQPSMQRPPGMVFVPVPEAKTLKNRIHIDLAPPIGASQEEEVERLLAKGASRVDVGQSSGTVSWVVLADPEGNEFCVLSPRE